MAHPTTSRTPIRTTTALLGLAGLLTLGACSAEPAAESPATGSAAEDGASGPDGGTQSLSPGATAGAETTDAPAGFIASLQDVEGELGSAEIRDAGGALEFQVQASGMEPGLYGLHVHETGECDPDSAARTTRRTSAPSCPPAATSAPTTPRTRTTPVTCRCCWCRSPARPA